jgi:hypothetical protein
MSKLRVLPYREESHRSGPRAVLEAQEAQVLMRELESRMSIPAPAEKPPDGFVSRLLRELGLKKEPSWCAAYTRQAVPCRRPATHGKFCRLHAPPAGRRSAWTRIWSAIHPA